MKDIRVYHIRSQDRTSGTVNDFNINIDDFGFQARTAKMKVIAATIPWSFYAINSSNNVIYFNEDGSTSDNAVIAPGNYTPSELADEIATKMTAAATADITCIVDSKSGKFTISSDGATLQLETSNVLNTAWNILGFSTGTNKTGATEYSSEEHYDLLDGRYSLHVNCSIHSSHIYNSNLGSEGRTLAVIPIEGSPRSILHLKKGDESTSTIVNTLPISSIGFQLKFGDNSFVDLNGKHWEITMELESVRDDPEPNENSFRNPYSRA